MAETMTTALCVFNDTKIGDTYCSFKPDDFDAKIKLYNAINNPDKRVADCINEQIKVRDVVIKAVKLSEERNNANNWTDETPAKERDGFRVILIDEEGTSYSATSAGIYNSVATIRSVFGQLHFDDPLTVKVNQVKTKNGNTLTLRVVG